jgi:hypothetical protein
MQLHGLFAVVLLTVNLVTLTKGQRTLVSLSKKLKLLNDAEKKRAARSASMASFKGKLVRLWVFSSQSRE